MTLKEHHKHNNIPRPAIGNYCRSEWAILGSTCSVIQGLADSITAALTSQYKSVYLDASHKEELVEGSRKLVDYTSHSTRDEMHFNKKLNAFQFRQLFSEADFALVNGNHLKARSQVVIVDGAKRSSLQKRIAALTDVQLILLADNEVEIFDFLKEAIPAWQSLPVYPLNDTARIIGFFTDQLKAKQPLLNGLVLAGGKSQRMGHDKTTIAWHGKEQRYYIADLIKPFCKEVFISCREEQQETVDPDYNTLTDSFTNLGPYGAILSAFRQQPDAAWLVIASDLPLLNADTIRELVANRKTAAIATTYAGYQGLPEPLITIWEPKSYAVLLAQLAQGYSCPRKLLINYDTHIVTPLDPGAIMNVNTPEEATRARQLLEMKYINTDAK